MSATHSSAVQNSWLALSECSHGHYRNHWMVKFTVKQPRFLPWKVYGDQNECRKGAEARCYRRKCVMCNVSLLLEKNNSMTFFFTGRKKNSARVAQRIIHVNDCDVRAVVNRICPCWGNSRILSPSSPFELMTVDSWCHCCDWQVTRRAAFDAEAAVYGSYVAHYDEHSWRQRRHSVILVWLLTVYDGDDRRGSRIRRNWKDISHLDRELNSDNCWLS